jgi:hypothetical protein
MDPEAPERVAACTLAQSWHVAVRAWNCWIVFPGPGRPVWLSMSPPIQYPAAGARGEGPVPAGPQAYQYYGGSNGGASGLSNASVGLI